MADSTIHAHADDAQCRRWIGVLGLANDPGIGFALRP
jgi:hypothetical protein